MLATESTLEITLYLMSRVATECRLEITLYFVTRLSTESTLEMLMRHETAARSCWKLFEDNIDDKTKTWCPDIPVDIISGSRNDI